MHLVLLLELKIITIRILSPSVLLTGGNLMFCLRVVKVTTTSSLFLISMNSFLPSLFDIANTPKYNPPPPFPRSILNLAACRVEEAEFNASLVGSLFNTSYVNFQLLYTRQSFTIKNDNFLIANTTRILSNFNPFAIFLY